MNRSDWTFIGVLALFLLMMFAAAFGYLVVMGVV